MDRITLSGIRLEGRLGASEDERAYPQTIEVDLEVGADLTAASESDALADTVDYGPLIEATVRTAEQGSHVLLEGLAGAIARAAIATSPRVSDVTVRVRKLAVPMDVDMDHAEVEIRRPRS
jgi:7,8-dihydroneopterin aldolase/epimerase/oxygenase